MELKPEILICVLFIKVQVGTSDIKLSEINDHSNGKSVQGQQEQGHRKGGVGRERLESP